MPRPTVFIALDIDGTLATEVDRELRELIAQAANEHRVFYYKYSPYIVHPGVYEFIRYLAAQPDFDFGTFSAGQDERNRLFTRFVLINALGEAEYLRRKNSVKICSREQLQTNSFYQDKKQLETYGYNAADQCYKKNLTAIFPAMDIEWAVLVDDVPEVVAYGQERSYLYAPPAEQKHLTDIMNTHGQTVIAWNSLQRVNHIFFITGLLCSALAQAEKENKTLAHCLFERQYIRNGKNSYALIDSSQDEEKNYFQCGLDELKKYNSTLSCEYLQQAQHYLAGTVPPPMPAQLQSSIHFFARQRFFANSQERFVQQVETVLQILQDHAFWQQQTLTKRDVPVGVQQMHAALAKLDATATHKTKMQALQQVAKQRLSSAKPLIGLITGTTERGRSRATQLLYLFLADQWLQSRYFVKLYQHWLLDKRQEMPLRKFLL